MYSLSRRIHWYRFYPNLSGLNILSSYLNCEWITLLFGHSLITIMQHICHFRTSLLHTSDPFQQNCWWHVADLSHTKLTTSPPMCRVTLFHLYIFFLNPVTLMLIAGLESTTLITLWLLMIKQPINKEYKAENRTWWKNHISLYAAILQQNFWTFCNSFFFLMFYQQSKSTLSKNQPKIPILSIFL